MNKLKNDEEVNSLQPISKQFYNEIKYLFLEKLLKHTYFI